jgi:predicted secreted protein with PEFG-CTERM motif
MTNKKFLIVFSICIIFLFIQIQNSYGHGWGIDTTSIEVDDREISISVEIPQDFEELDDKYITITAIDEENKEHAKNVTFLIGLSHNDQIIFRHYFFTPDGSLIFNVIPTAAPVTKITAEKDPLLDAWYETDSKPILLEGPIFNSGGLYNFEIELRTIDEPNNIVENLGTYNVDISMAQTEVHQSKSIDGKEIDFKTKSYFDKILNFNYEPENNIITFEMPFDWSEKTVSHIPVVHTEIHFPKNFADFLKPGYIGKINDIDLFKSNVIIDDYTEEDERIVHFVLLQDHLQYLKQEQKRILDNPPTNMLFSLEVSDRVNFPMKAMTRDEKYSVDLSWDPLEIEPNKNTKFVFTIRDGATGEPLRQSSYDFVILQNNIEVYRTSGKATVGGDFEDYTFTESQTGPTVIRFENIRGSGSDTEFGLVVIPEFGWLAVIVLTLGFLCVIPISKKYFKVNY